MSTRDKTEVQWRDMSVPYSEEEIEATWKYFLSSPTYIAEDGGSVASAEVPQVLEAMRLKRNPEQAQVYTEYWNTYFNGRIVWKVLLDIFNTLHNNHEFLRALAKNCDKDNDGFITSDEFDDLLHLMKLHDPKLSQLKLSFEEFVQEADTDKDGRVSVDECGDWLELKVNSLAMA